MVCEGRIGEPGIRLTSERNKAMNERILVSTASGGLRRGVMVLQIYFQKSRQLFIERIAQKIVTGEGGQSSIRKGHLILIMQDGIGN